MAQDETLPTKGGTPESHSRSSQKQDVHTSLTRWLSHLSTTVDTQPTWHMKTLAKDAAEATAYNSPPREPLESLSFGFG